MIEYKKLLVLISAIENLDGIQIPFNLIKDHIKPIKEYCEKRVEEIEGKLWSGE